MATKPAVSNDEGARDKVIGAVLPLARLKRGQFIAAAAIVILATAAAYFYLGRGFRLGRPAVLRQNLVTIDIVIFLRPSATLYRYEGITILAVLLFQSNTQRAMQFGF